MSELEQLLGRQRWTCEGYTGCPCPECVSDRDAVEILAILMIRLRGAGIVSGDVKFTGTEKGQAAARLFVAVEAVADANR